MPITISGTGAITGATTSYSFDNNVSIGGTLTYEDFTNVDSVGLITARSGIHVTGGSVGIGTTIPNAPIHVAKDGTGQVLARFESNMGTNNGRSISISSPSTDSASEPFIFGTGNSIQFLIDENINIIDSEGRLGINTTNTESTKLRVYLDASDTSKYFWGGGSRGLQISDSTDTNAGDTTTFHKASASGQYKWTNLTGDRMHLESSGELIIKPDHGNGNNALSLGIERAWYFKQINSGSSTALGMYSTSNKSLEIGGDTNSAPTMTVTTGTTKTVYFHGNGSMVGTLTQNTSDRKFKENIVDAPSQLADVSALQLRTWDWNDLAPGNEDRNARHKIGLVAQEAELIDPNLVYDADVLEGEDTYKAIDYHVLTMKLLGAVSELKAELEQVKAAQQTEE